MSPFFSPFFSPFIYSSKLAIFGSYHTKNANLLKLVRGEKKGEKKGENSPLKFLWYFLIF